MDFNSFKLKYAETMIFYQAIEHDIKCIYAFMMKGDVNKHLDSIDNKTLGQMVRLLRKLDNSNSTQLISANDYNFLEKICDNRNHWAHSVFTDFLYKENWITSKEYLSQCERLNTDYDRIKKASKILEKIRIKYCISMKR